MTVRTARPYTTAPHDTSALRQASGVYIRVLKPAADIAFAAVGLLFCTPLLWVAAAVVWSSSKGPVFYHQSRTGRGGLVFTLHKLRTMHVDAESDGIRQTVVDDKRIVRGAQWIRRMRIDEAPQFWNVIKGEMSIIGPRPERPEYVASYEASIPAYSDRHLLRPGITGLAQVTLPYAASVDETAAKLIYDREYVRNCSAVVDAVILVRTLGVVLRPTHGR